MRRVTLSIGTRGSPRTGKKRVSDRCSIRFVACGRGRGGLGGMITRGRRFAALAPQAQERLRGHDHERTLLGDLRLTAEEVEVLRRRREVGDAQIALGGDLEEA